MSANGVVVIAEASGAAILWALGTVLGRYLSREIEFQHVLSLRFFFGFLASAIALLVMNQPAYSNGHDTLLILYLALVTGLLALGLYYFGLQHTPAMMASLAELTYPAVAVIAGIYAYDQHLTVEPVARHRDHPRDRDAPPDAATAGRRRPIRTATSLPEPAPA